MTRRIKFCAAPRQSFDENAMLNKIYKNGEDRYELEETIFSIQIPWLF